ncbi:MAG: aminotransferase class V-fold PLP-dependent enzyme [Gemmatimonadetes bacterium]|nr:aminotransferase class V-fold PLP-dependent enzyme [Gemmatimonadota bacterium]
MSHYLDYAATSAVRPPSVCDAVSEFLASCGATPGRGGHSASVEAGRVAFRCRRALMKVLGLPGDPGRLAFLQNATHALNTALWGTLRRGDVVVVSAYDHNAVLRPVHYLARERGVEVRMVEGAPDGSVDLDAAERLLDGARLLVVNAASNVLGTRMPLAELAKRARAAGALVLVDAAQSAGHLDESHAEQGADMVAFTGHKGLLGPQGTGGLWVREGVDVEPFLAGGTGGDSNRRDMPDAMPDRLEAGTGNAPGLAGLLAGCEYLLETGVAALHRREAILKARLRDGLAAVPGVRVLSPPAPGGVAVVTLVSDHADPATLATRLDREHGVMTRSGLHCAPEVHRLLGTSETGALRFSLGWASTEEDVDRAVEAMDAITGSATVPVA